MAITKDEKATDVFASATGIVREVLSQDCKHEWTESDNDIGARCTKCGRISVTEGLADLVMAEGDFRRDGDANHAHVFRPIAWNDIGVSCVQCSECAMLVSEASVSPGIWGAVVAHFPRSRVQPFIDEAVEYKRQLERASLQQVQQDRMRLADEAQTLRDENTRLHAMISRLERQAERRR